MKIKVSDLREKVIASLMKNFSKEESGCIADYLVWAEMSGINTQGIIKLTGNNPLQNIKPKSEIKIEKDTKLSQLINAGAYPAPLVSQQATDVAIAKAKESGFSIVGVHNSFSSNGAQAYYVEQMARNDLIGIMMSRSPASVAAFGSIDPLFGTNPVGFSFPTNDRPLTFDMATSAMTFLGLILAKAKGETIPDNTAIDSDGAPTNDPAKAMDGALLPFDRSYKGAGLGMVVEIMAGPLVAAAFCDNKTYEEEWGSVFIAIDPNLLTDVSKFKSDCSEMIKTIKSSRKMDSVESIRIPGESAKLCFEESEKSGYVNVEDTLLKQLGYI